LKLREFETKSPVCPHSGFDSKSNVMVVLEVDYGTGFIFFNEDVMGTKAA
jgi:hypothetical protein